jgi:putative nucleotidyltransferase with HDIG domain
MILARDVYTWDDNKVPLLSGGTVLGDRALQMLSQYDIFEVAVTDDTREASSDYVPRTPPIIEAELCEEAIHELEEFFNLAQTEDNPAAVAQVVKHIDEIVGQLVSSIMADKSAVINISDLKSYDEYTYHHSLSVAVMAIAIGQAMNLDEAELNRLGWAGMLHDIGKTAIPLDILNKPEKLDEQEFSVMKTHSAQGYQYMMKNGIGDGEMWSAVLSHHEKYDGSGYPNGMHGRAIPLLARILAVADVYDALTSYRPYRHPMAPADVVEYIMGNISKAFDYDVVKAFLKKVELYPVGSFIELSNGQLAVVLENENIMRPVIRLLENGQVIDLYTDRNHLNLTIIQVLAELPDDLNASANFS